MGGGFGGSLLAMILSGMGLRVTLVERERHPRFAIGESSTPLANLVLEQLCHRYGLDAVLPLTRYGSWKRAHPEIGCGAKRGFTFVGHRPGAPYSASGVEAGPLLVAASASEEDADTHWYRADVDAFLSDQAREAGVEVLEATAVVGAQRRMGGGWTLSLSRDQTTESIEAERVVDATGGAGPLAEALGMTDRAASLRTRSRAVFSHFRDVGRFQEVFEAAGGETSSHPFPLDQAALHHILADGWLWCLRFDNGITSVGRISCAAEPVGSAQEEWEATLAAYPGLALQFAVSEPVRPLVRTGWLQRRVARSAGSDWVLLPGAAYFVDPILSPGNAHTLIGVERVARAFEAERDGHSFSEAARRYDEELQAEIEFVDDLAAGCYASLGCPELLHAFTMYYFAGAHFSETQRRAGSDGEAEGFLTARDPRLRRAVQQAREQIERLTESGPPSRQEVATFVARVRDDIVPWNLIGLCDPARKNLYPFA